MEIEKEERGNDTSSSLIYLSIYLFELRLLLPELEALQKLQTLGRLDSS